MTNRGGASFLIDFRLTPDRPAWLRSNDSLGKTVDYVIPWDKKFVLAANVGQPLLTSKFRWNKSFKALSQIVDSIENESLRRGSADYLAGYQPHADLKKDNEFRSELDSTNDREGV